MRLVREQGNTTLKAIYIEANILLQAARKKQEIDIFSQTG
jgi:hypothetical protein